MEPRLIFLTLGEVELVTTPLQWRVMPLHIAALLERQLLLSASEDVY